ncbi:MAG: enoyl-CoA hydratase [Rhodospirillaceae bacterium]|jgi:enoyl-CoA hydratase|nr:enoyl-CoA hydratase [Rhodospirillaceae bacterium]MBT4046343.1 enoyl-CoA hydratase [Rhodospirillaceae bacterium]MBT4690789.1 enoyl-CoA hydratase [Rhodospirillaceae bacterium]MBT5080529.1 enoyl-CoA hydratase [Rhodospirillaceae bacterium]MBT5526602.1 enoyl-CoA hydratase [Rhodospirillaceae bacterium]
MTDGQPTVHVEIEERSARGVRGRVAWVRMDNPRKLNAGSAPLVAKLISSFENLAKDDGLRAAVLTGAGDRAFMAGADLNELTMLKPESARHFITQLHLAAQAIRALPVPVIGRLRGFCLGAGLELAAACDFRVADESFVMGMPEVKVGLPSVIEAALLPRLIGWGKTRELLLMGGNYDADEALAMHFVEKMVPAGELDAWVENWLERILAAGPVAIRSQKSLIGKWEELGLGAAIEVGIDHFSDAYGTDEPLAMLASYVKPKT